jgi:hypothetical protein
VITTAVALGVLLAAGVYLEKMNGQEVGSWVIAAACLGYIAFRHQGDLATMAVWTLIDAILILRVFGADIEIPPMPRF